MAVDQRQHPHGMWSHRNRLRVGKFRNSTKNFSSRISLSRTRIVRYWNRTVSRQGWASMKKQAHIIVSRNPLTFVVIAFFLILSQFLILFCSLFNGGKLH